MKHFAAHATSSPMFQASVSKLTRTLLFAWVTLLSISSQATHTFQEIDVCYHWLEPEQLQVKIDYADTHNGDLLFYGGSVVYCWRSPLGAYSSWEPHGDELIRIKLNPESVKKTRHMPRHESIEATLAADAHIIYSNNFSWHEYTITPNAVESWSINQPQTIQEEWAELAYYKSGKVTDNDVFYPFNFFSFELLRESLSLVIQAHEEKSKTGPRIYGSHQKSHFETRFTLPWHAYLKAPATPPAKVETPPSHDFQQDKVDIEKTIQVISASYGLNLSKKNKGNVTDSAKKGCDGKTTCHYKIDAKFFDGVLKNVIAYKDFHIDWKCGKKKKKHTVKKPADGTTFVLNCE